MRNTPGRILRNYVTAITLALACSFAWQTPANATDPAQDENLAYAIGVQTYISGFPPMGDRHYWYPIGDMYHDFDANLAWDTVGSQGGAFAFCPPGWQGVLPQGVRRVDVGTPFIWTLGRLAVSGADDVPAAVALQRQTRLVPLSQWGKDQIARPNPDPADYFRLTRADLTDARAYFTGLNELLRLAPRMGNPIDEAMVGWLREIGMEPTARFDWDALSPETRRGLERATVDAHRIIAERMPRVMPIVNHWQIIRLDRRMSGKPVIAASGAMLGLLWNPVEINGYDITFFDGSGARLDGSNRYVLRLNPPPPVNAFWSVTMYAADTAILVPNPINRYSVGDRTPGIVYGEGGKVDVIIQHEMPDDPTERANWLPAPAGPFYLRGHREDRRHDSSIRGVVTEPDGSFTVVFGGEQCRDKAPNWIHTPEDGWSLLLRAYRPRVEEFKAYQMPALRRID